MLPLLGYLSVCSINWIQSNISDVSGSNLPTSHVSSNISTELTAPNSTASAALPSLQRRKRTRDTKCTRSVKGSQGQGWKVCHTNSSARFLENRTQSCPTLRSGLRSRRLYSQTRHRQSHPILTLSYPKTLTDFGNIFMRTE